MKTKHKQCKISLKKSDRPNYWYRDREKSSIVFKSMSGKVLKREIINTGYVDLIIAYNEKICTIWRHIYFLINRTNLFDFGFTNLVNSNFIDFTYPIKLKDDLYYLKMNFKFYKINKTTFRKCEITSVQYTIIPDKFVVLDFGNYGIKSPGSRLMDPDVVNSVLTV